MTADVTGFLSPAWEALHSEHLTLAQVHCEHPGSGAAGEDARSLSLTKVENQVKGGKHAPLQNRGTLMIAPGASMAKKKRRKK